MNAGDTITMAIDKIKSEAIWYKKKVSFAHRSFEEHKETPLVPFIRLASGMQVK